MRRRDEANSVQPRIELAHDARIDRVVLSMRQANGNPPQSIAYAPEGAPHPRLGVAPECVRHSTACEYVNAHDQFLSLKKSRCRRVAAGRVPPGALNYRWKSPAASGW